MAIPLGRQPFKIFVLTGQLENSEEIAGFDNAWIVKTTAAEWAPNFGRGWEILRLDSYNGNVDVQGLQSDGATRFDFIKHAGGASGNSLNTTFKFSGKEKVFFVGAEFSILVRESKIELL